MSLKNRVISWLASQDVDAYLVGGCVRDHLLHRDSYDLDVAVSCDGLAVARSLADRFGGAYHPLDSERGTGRAILWREGGDRLLVDIARLRGQDLAADLVGRDFTINSMAVDVRSPATVIDHHDGLVDLEAGLIRTVSQDAIRNDPVRALRAFRQAAQLGFSLDRDTEEIIRRDGPALAAVSAERICDELGKLLACERSAPFLVRLDSLALLSVILPELEPLRGLTQPPPHCHNALVHSLESVRALEVLLGELEHGAAQSGARGQLEGEGLPLGDLRMFTGQLGEHLQRVVSDARPRLVVVKMASLLHDVGKPSTRTVDGNGHIRYLGHEEVGSRLAADRLRNLRFSSDEVDLAASIVRHHMRPLTLAREGMVTSRAVYRFFRDTGEAGVDVLLHALADHLATYAFEVEEGGWQQLVALVTGMVGDYWKQESERACAQLLLSGHDLLEEFGLEPGPEIGRLLEAVREAQAIGEVGTRVEAMALVSSLLAS